MTNEYTDIGGSSPSYDFAGNMTTDAAGYVYYYDKNVRKQPKSPDTAPQTCLVVIRPNYHQEKVRNRTENRLTKITDAEPCDVAVYSYDALGRRIEKITYDPCGVAEATTRYYYDGWRVFTETDGCDVRQREYTYGNYVDEVLIMTDNRSGETEDDHYYLHDHLFSPVALLGEDATVLERYEYDAYGKVYFLASNFSLLGTQTSGHGNPVTFTGQRLDELDEGNLLIMYYKNRYYLTDIGRFAQRDPLGERDGLCLVSFRRTGTPWFPRQFDPVGQYRDGVNIYTYVANRPVRRQDAYGLCWEEDYMSFVVSPPPPPAPSPEWLKYPDEIGYGRKGNSICINFISYRGHSDFSRRNPNKAPSKMDACMRKDKTLTRRLMPPCGAYCCHVTIVLKSCAMGGFESTWVDIKSSVVPECPGVTFTVCACQGIFYKKWWGPEWADEKGMQCRTYGP